ncbi:MAG: ATP-binding protein [Acidimicrobiia bacterium]
MNRRMIASYLTITILVLAILEIPLAVVYNTRERDRIGDAVTRDASALASYYEDSLQNASPPSPAKAVAYARTTNTRVTIVQVDGISVVDTAQDSERDFSTRPEIVAALNGSRTVGSRHSTTLDRDLLYVAVPVASNGHVYGAVRITADLSRVTNRIHRFWIGLLGIAAIVIALVLGVGLALARSVSRPLRALSATATRFALGDLRPGTAIFRGPAEIRELSETMNTMAQRLDELLSEQRAFVADASHQLRTPLTSMRLRLENLESTADVSQMADVSATIVETERLTTLVNDLLHLARAEELPSAEPIRIDELTRERADTWSAVAEEKGVTLSVQCPSDEVWVYAVPGAVEQVLDNVLDNAITASPDGAAIEVTVRQGPQDSELVVTDHGPGMTPEQQAHALERFWRGDTRTPGSGLGLSIVDALVRASGGFTHLGDTPGGGLTITITLQNVPPENL